jgi:hypothetical protein
MSKILLLSFLLCLPSKQSAQTNSQPVVFVKALSATTATGVTQPFRSIGQTVHHVDVYGMGANCIPNQATGLLSLEGSNDGTNYVSFGAPITQLVGPGPGAYSAQAHVVASESYQYVRLNYSSVLYFGTPTCPITAYYTGTIPGALFGSQPFTALDDGFNYFVTPISAAGTTSIGFCPVGSPLQVYSMIINASGGANTVSFSDLTGTNIGWDFKVNLTAANPSFIVPQGSRPHFFVPYGGSESEYTFTLTQSAATEVDYSISYRCE